MKIEAMCLIGRAIYLVFSLGYLFLLSWADSGYVYEVLLYYLMVFSLAFMGLASSDLPQSGKGMLIVVIVVFLGVLGCLLDVYRLHESIQYGFDGISVLVVVSTIALMLIYLFNSIDIYNGTKSNCS